MDKVGKGGVGAKDGLIALFRGLDKDYRGMVDKLGDTWDGLMNRLKAAWEYFQKEVMNGSGVLKAIESQVKLLVDYFQDLKAKGELSTWARNMARNVINALDGIARAVVALIKVFSGLLQMTVRLGGVVNWYNGVVANNKTDQAKIEMYAAWGEASGNWDLWKPSDEKVKERWAAVDQAQKKYDEAKAAADGFKKTQEDINGLVETLGKTEYLDKFLDQWTKVKDTTLQGIDAAQARDNYDRQQRMLRGEDAPP